MVVSRDYDLGLIITPEAGDERARAIVDRVTTTVARIGGQVVRVNVQGRRRLAYPIDHHRDGLYFFFDLILPPDNVGEVDRLLRVNEDVLRHLILVRDPRVVAVQRQREAEAEARAEAEAQARAAAEVEAQAEAQARVEAEAEAATEVEAEATQPEAEGATETATAETAAAEPQQAEAEEQVATEPEADA
jgi:small subunit ribosomal protein S6